MSEKAIITYRFHQEAFEFLGNETVITESTVPSDFKQIWNDFFEMGGYAPHSSLCGGSKAHQRMVPQ